MGSMASAKNPALRSTDKSVKADSRYCLDAGTGASRDKVTRGGC